MFEPVRLNLQCIRINLPFPKPICTTKLDVLRIDSRYCIQRLKQSLTQITILNTKADVGDPVFNPVNGIANRQRLKVIWVLPIAVNKMSIATLHAETIRQFVKAVYEIDDRRINHFIAKTGQNILALILVMRIFHQFFRFCEGFQFYKGGSHLNY